MAPPPLSRRASYGPTSPVVGERGARTRQQIVDVTLRLFADRGFHNTLVDDIAREVGISRATLYQYFESKEQIFVGLVEESGAALMRVVRRLGRLGPTAEGFENLHWWLGQWGWVYDRYATVFIEWANVNSPQAPLRPLLTTFVENHTKHLAARFAEAGVEGIDHAGAAVALLSAVERCHYYRKTRPTGLREDELVDALACIFQLVLFPRTPASVLAGGQPGGDVAPPRAEFDAIRPEPRVTPEQWQPDRFSSLSEQAHKTVRQLLDAGGRVFAASGYHGSNVDRIVTEAGLARGTFYKYFDDKFDLLVTLAHECAARLLEMADGFVALGDGPDRGAALRLWLGEFVSFHEQHAGVFRVWTENGPSDPQIDATGDAATQAALRAFRIVLRRIDRAFPFDAQAASLVLVALLERFPDEASGSRYELDRAETIEVMAAFIERGLLDGGRAPRRRSRLGASPD